MNAVAQRPETTAEYRVYREQNKLFSATVEDNNLFAKNFDHTPFEFRHKMHEQPIFQLPALMELAERLAKKNDQKSHYESGAPDVNGYFGSRPEGQTIVDALESIRQGKNWVILKRIHEDPMYREALKSVIPELSALSGVDMEEVYYDPTMTVFVTSPGRITPYHMDGETNFLAQIHGTKLCYIYDGNDPAILSQQDMEKYWTGNLPKIDYPAGMPVGKWQYQLKPGNGVFNPATFPHWLQNGPDVSVSVSMNFKRKRNAVIGAHRTNHFLRGMGLKPTAPCKSPTLDQAKQMTFGSMYEAAYAARGFVRKTMGK